MRVGLTRATQETAWTGCRSAAGPGIFPGPAGGDGRRVDAQNNRARPRSAIRERAVALARYHGRGHRPVTRPVMEATGCMKIGRAAIQPAITTSNTTRKTAKPHQLSLP